MRNLMLTTALLCALDAAAYGQSLADVAKREEERRKSVGSSSRVYTNQDLPEASRLATPPPAAIAAPAPEADTSKKEDGEAAADAAKNVAKDAVNVHRDEKHWRERAQNYRTRMSKLRSDVAGTESRLDTLRAANQTPAVLSEIQMAERDLRKFQTNLEIIEKEWAQVEEKARTAGASAWIQE